MKFYKYLEDLDIHFIDYSGQIGMEEGLFRIKALEKIFIKVHESGKSLRILMDARDYLKASPETHDKLAKISHQKFDIDMADICKYTAVLNDKFEFPKSEFEHWFTDKQEAINWLLLQEA